MKQNLREHLLILTNYSKAQSFGKKHADEWTGWGKNGPIGRRLILELRLRISVVASRNNIVTRNKDPPPAPLPWRRKPVHRCTKHCYASASLHEPRVFWYFVSPGSIVFSTRTSLYLSKRASLFLLLLFFSFFSPLKLPTDTSKSWLTCTSFIVSRLQKFPWISCRPCSCLFILSQESVFKNQRH